MTSAYGFSYVMEDVGLAFLPGLLSSVPSFAFGLVAYVLTALALYDLARRRGIAHAWLSWVPVLNVWIIGSLSDQYRYVVKGQIKSKRKALLILEILKAVLCVCVVVLCGVVVVSLLGGLMYDVKDFPPELMASVLSMLALCLPLLGVSIAVIVLRYMALYDIYVSCDPGNSVLFLVLSIFVGITEPFFLFFSRQKDEGMPPRRENPADPVMDGEVI